MSRRLQSTRSFKCLGSNLDEFRWVINIRKFLDEELKEDDDADQVPVSIFTVPKLLISSNPDCYTPQQVAISPYHQWRQQLFEMERHKLASARRIQKQFQCSSSTASFQSLVQHLEKLEPRIRACYNKYFDISAETLALMMAVNASFLLEFLGIYVFDENKTTTPRIIPRMSHLIDYTGTKSAHNSILRDIVMLENQVPLFVLRKLLEIQYSSLESANDQMLSILKGLYQELSPFKTIDNSPNIDVSNCHHVLDFLYQMVVPKLEEPTEPVIEPEEPKEPSTGEEQSNIDSNNTKQLLIQICKMLSKLSPNYKPFRFIVNFMKELEKEPDLEQAIAINLTNMIQKPPLVEEITIPSVADLTKAGVRILPTKGNISTVSFDVQTVTLYLPITCIDMNTEVVLRNLVAYEASYALGPLVFTRYTELMNGIIDTEEDVRLLREKGIIQNHLKSDKEAADMWNGMSKSIRLTKVPFLDKVIEDVNKYYNGRLNVKLNNLVKYYVYGSWQFLTLLAAIMLLFLMTFQVFCSVYSCSKVFGMQNSE